MNIQTLLVVDDIDISRDVVGAMLKKLGYSVDMAENGAHAIEKIKAAHFGMVFMDVEMPVMDGYDATRMIRQGLKRDSKILPIVALTAHSRPQDIARCYEAGMDDVLTKPFEFIELAAKVDEWLSGGSDSWDIAERDSLSYTEAPLISEAELNNYINIVGINNALESYDAFINDMAARLLMINISASKEDILRPTLHDMTAASGSLGMKKLSLYTKHLLKQGVARDRLVEDEEIDLLDKMFQDSCAEFALHVKK